MVVRAASKPGSATSDGAKLVAMRATGGTAALVASLVGLLASCVTDSLKFESKHKRLGKSRLSPGRVSASLGCDASPQVP